MRLRPPAFWMLVTALATAGCAEPVSTPPTLGSVWRPQLGLPAVVEAPVSPEAPGRTTGLPGAAASPSPVPIPFTASDTGMNYRPADTITFQSDRRPTEGGYDVYIYDPAQDTVLAVMGVNTRADETNPNCSDDGQWLVFQRGVAGPSGIQQDILLYNRLSRMVSTLSRVNSTHADETEPAISADGTRIVYVSNETGYPAIRLYDVVTGDAFEVPGANRRLLRVGAPSLSGDGRRIAYEASGALDPDATDIYLYDIPTATQLTPPFVNTVYREATPELSGDGTRLLFSSDRLGSDDLFEVDLESGNTDNLALLNSDHDERNPRYLGGAPDRIVFNLTTREEYPLTVLRAFNRQTMQIDTLPVANSLLGNSAVGR